MATKNVKSRCSICNDEQDTYECKGCLTIFCFNHLTDHREMINQDFIQIEHHFNSFRQKLDDQKEDPNHYSLFKQVNKWENESNNKIQQTAQKCRDQINKYLFKIENEFNELSEKTKEIRKQNKINEINSKQIQEKLKKLNEDFEKPTKVLIEQKSSTFIHQIFVRIEIDKDQQWKQQGVNILGGNQQGIQLSDPWGIFIDDHQNIFIADNENHRIGKGKLNSTSTQIVAGEKENRLCRPTDVIIDKENNSLIIADSGNRRVIRLPRQKNTNGEILISNIDCHGLTMDKNGSLYVSDYKKNEVRRWKRGDEEGIVVAGGNGEGDGLNQLNGPSFIFVDEYYSLFVSDSANHRVMKWIKDAKEGIVVAGGNGQGDRLTQLSSPEGVIVDQLGQIYVADCKNHRVMRWCEGCKEGTIIVGGNGPGKESNQLNCPIGLSFDEEGNLYVADCGNNRIQKFDLI